MWKWAVKYAAMMITDATAGQEPSHSNQRYRERAPIASRRREEREPASKGRVYGAGARFSKDPLALFNSSCLTNLSYYLSLGRGFDTIYRKWVRNEYLASSVQIGVQQTDC